MQIEVLLHRGRGVQLNPPPGRILLVGGTHTFADLARAIDVAFGRWDLHHLHVFELADGRLVGQVDPDDPDEGWIDAAMLTISETLVPNDTLTYLFDLSDEWQHTLRVAAELVDPRIEHGEVPVRPTPIWGWGTLPDQFGRTHPND